MEIFKGYEKLTLAIPNVWFVGRLATYRYYNMDQVVGQALATFRRIAEVVPLKKLSISTRPLNSERRQAGASPGLMP
jgi:UDP-galactopyranose mutase